MGISSISSINTNDHAGRINRYPLTHDVIDAQENIIKIQRETVKNHATPMPAHLSAELKKQRQQLNMEVRSMIIGVPKSSWPAARLQYQLDEAVFRHPSSLAAVQYAREIKDVQQSTSRPLLLWPGLLLFLSTLGSLFVWTEMKKSLRALAMLRSDNTEGTV